MYSRLIPRAAPQRTRPLRSLSTSIRASIRSPPRCRVSDRIFEAPSFNYFNGTIHSPVYQEWNLQIQRDLGGSYALILAYNGNHGIKIPYSNTWGNAYDPEAYGLPGALYPTVGAIAQGAAPNPSYGTVN